MHIDGSALSLSRPPAKVLATNDDDEEFAIEHENTTAAGTVEKIKTTTCNDKHGFHQHHHYHYFLFGIHEQTLFLLR